jgi:putative heme iron utilization protein
MLLSHLSQHTKNLDADPRCGLTLSESGGGDVQQRARLSAIGNVLSLESSADTASYFAYFPQTRVYHDELGFRFYRLQPLRFHWNGGFATARWFDPSRIVHEKPFSLEVTKQILGHMNRDHANALLHYVRPIVDRRPDGPATMVGIDAEGMDLRVSDHLYRVAFPRRVTSPEEARAVLVEMAAGSE